MRVISTRIIPGLLCTGFLFASCASKEITQLQQSVQNLERRVYRYQQDASQETAQTTSTLSEVNQTINQSFRDLRNAQSSLESQAAQTAGRVDRMERAISRLEEKTRSLDTFSTDSYATLSQQLTQTQESLQSQSQQELRAMQNEVAALAAAVKELRSEQSRTQASLRGLENQVSSMEEENRKIYRQILQELGVKVPEPEATTSGQAAPAGPVEDSGNTHTIQKGETLSTIATKYGVRVQDLQTLNGIQDPSKIRLGQRLKIPK
ncbi:MAG: LysM peptidoglycan-binding domain-containing protein [bacterium]